MSLSVRDEIISDPPKVVFIRVKLPVVTENKKVISDFLWREYHFEIATDDSDYYEMLFYNYDLRSLMGRVIGYDGGYVELLILTEFYVPGWEELWEKLVRNSVVVTRDQANI